MRVGTLQPTTLMLGTRNKIRGNTIGGTRGPGLLFAPGTANNDGQGNTYVNVQVPVEDYGRGNLWP